MAGYLGGLFCRIFGNQKFSMDTKIPTFWFHVCQVIFLLAILGAITFQIVRPTNTQKTVVQAGGSKVDYWQGAAVKPGFGGCVTIQAVKTPVP